MGSLLAEQFRKKVNSLKDPRMKNEKVPEVAYPTGFLGIDFLNVAYIPVAMNGEKFSYPSVGIVDGSYVEFIGRTGAGKSTICVQIASNIIRPFPKSCCFEDQTEAGVMDSRKCVLSGYYGDELKNRFITR